MATHGRAFTVAPLPVCATTPARAGRGLPDRESTSSQQSIADAGGIVVTEQSERDPCEVLDELMVVVEALCPTWPSRDVFSSTGLWLL